MRHRAGCPQPAASGGAGYKGRGRHGSARGWSFPGFAASPAAKTCAPADIRTEDPRGHERERWKNLLPRIPPRFRRPEPLLDRTVPHWKCRIPNWKCVVPHWECCVSHWECCVSHWECAIPHWKCGNPHWECAIPHWESGNPHWKRAVPHWECGVPHWKRAVPHWENRIPHWKHGILTIERVLPKRESHVLTAESCGGRMWRRIGFIVVKKSFHAHFSTTCGCRVSQKQLSSSAAQRLHHSASTMRPGTRYLERPSDSG